MGTRRNGSIVSVILRQGAKNGFQLNDLKPLNELLKIYASLKDEGSKDAYWLCWTSVLQPNSLTLITGKDVPLLDELLVRGCSGSDEWKYLILLDKIASSGAGGVKFLRGILEQHITKRVETRFLGQKLFLFKLLCKLACLHLYQPTANMQDELGRSNGGEDNLEIIKVLYLPMGNVFPLDQLISGNKTCLSSQTYVQMFKGDLYLFGDHNMILEIPKSHFSVQKGIESHLLLQVSGGVRQLYGQSIVVKQVRTLSLRINDHLQIDKLFRALHEPQFRVSESIRYLTLMSSELVPEEEECVEEGSSVPDITVVPTDDNLAFTQQLATPDQSDHWRPPANSPEESPTVLVQKRKMTRETTRTREELEKQFDLENSNPPNGVPITSSLIITKYNDKKSTVPDTRHKKVTPKRSVGLKDISVLNNIFNKSLAAPKKGAASNRSAQKVQSKGRVQKTPNRGKRERHLSSFPNLVKPVIQITTQDHLSKREKDVVTPTERNTRSKVNEQKIKPEVEVVKERTPEKAQSSLSPCEEIEIGSGNPNSGQCDAAGNSSHYMNNDSTTVNETVLGTATKPGPNMLKLPAMNANAILANQLQQQIQQAVTSFSDDMIHKLEIVNHELNNTILKRLATRYETVIHKLQTDFERDTEQIVTIFQELSTSLLNLSQDQLLAWLDDVQRDCDSRRAK
ncbi:Red1p KNAG_0F02960 [Huiozyma naganishii CBS 8797]|uniref:Uncharacterized protein n=1 Tax=Huiozyma naganishii (strain ATCC MYA-139 / BCRC 22969 / CBS 8797 / KCTC 17520 / NBRC 10181 / NCYC 3082 / Yp74L-3) TaxID=1071383 RepID=J7RN59_HUIN7|nr:hypothetical protein KNAG_0F02960 [Kazachstania naganishii CBS 8797]CCK70958.1 hypothetical protein KNAG_0F02960 [Kazachstania naganishii CBS 8797]